MKTRDYPRGSGRANPVDQFEGLGWRLPVDSTTTRWLSTCSPTPMSARGCSQRTSPPSSVSLRFR